MANPTPNDRYVLFLDILGFKDVVDTWQENGRRNALIELVRYISTAQSPFSATISVSDESVTLDVRPSITTFSDCIVVSFPTTAPVGSVPLDTAAVVASMWKEEVLRHMALLTARFAVRSLPLQLLLRGGLCQGELVHEERYIIGPGLNRAYRLEHSVADVPRIVVAEEIYENAPGLFPDILRADADGRVFLDYLPYLVNEISDRADAAAWRESRLQDIDWVIRTASSEGRRTGSGSPPRTSIKQKWEWFRPYFEEGTRVLS